MKEHFESNSKYTEYDIISLLEFLVDNIFVDFRENVFQEILGIPKGKISPPLLAQLFLYSYEAELI